MENFIFCAVCFLVSFAKISQKIKNFWTTASSICKPKNWMYSFLLMSTKQNSPLDSYHNPKVEERYPFLSARIYFMCSNNCMKDKTLLYLIF